LEAGKGIYSCAKHCIRHTAKWHKGSLLLQQYFVIIPTLISEKRVCCQDRGREQVSNLAKEDINNNQAGKMLKQH